jgi:nucleotide-binding universal stress UspA family protein
MSPEILAKDGGYDTIAVGRHGVSAKRRMFGGGVTEQLLKDASRWTIWVV